MTVVGTGQLLSRVQVSVEGLAFATYTDSAGRYQLRDVPPGPQTVLARRIGYAPVRASLTVPASGTLAQDFEMAESALNLPEITVTAEPAARARGEAATATVIDRDAIANQTAASLAGVLELLPGAPLQPPGLDGVQQVAVRTVPASEVSGSTAGGPGAADIASFGTSIVLDGVPVSNNANLQTTGPRGELQYLLHTSAGGGVDLRRFPATSIERVEVIRGIPSTRYGDLTTGVVVVDTRAGEMVPIAYARLDAHTLEGSFVAGRRFGERQTLAGNVDLSHTGSSSPRSPQDVTRISTQLSHRIGLGAATAGGLDSRQLTLDTRVAFYQVRQDNPEQPEIVEGLASFNHDWGVRVQTRAHLAQGRWSGLTATLAFDDTRRSSYAQSILVRGAQPFTDRLTEGRQEGRYIGGPYLAKLNLDGHERNAYARIEFETPGLWLGLDHHLVAGLELRREWNGGAGYAFDIEFPPQVTFNGVQGFDRPRPFDAVPPLATSALYVADQMTRSLGGSAMVELQAGLRVDALHRGGLWTSSIGDALLQPRLNLEVAPWAWLRVHGGWGRTAKAPSLADLYPAPQYFDVVNVNWFTTDPAERLAVLTTSIRDPTTADLGLSTGDKREVGLDLATPRAGAALSVVLFRDRTLGGVGFSPVTGYLLREHFNLTDSTIGDGTPPQIIEPPAYADTVPYLLDRPANILTLENTGVEATLSLPLLRPLGLKLDVSGAWVKTKLLHDAVDFGATFSDFQIDGRMVRAPYWDSFTNTGERAIITYRLIHHQPRFGLVVTAVIQHYPKEVVEEVGATDTLSFSGYVTRTGELVPVPPEERGDPQYADLHVSRSGFLTRPIEKPADWFASVQVSKTLPLGAELRFYAYNALDRLGRFDQAGLIPRQFPAMRFGLELTASLWGLSPFGRPAP